jgi:hypothetical protein
MVTNSFGKIEILCDQWEGSEKYKIPLFLDPELEQERSWCGRTSDDNDDAVPGFRVFFFLLA